ncbi:hypothetical protein [Halobacterium sp. CBA1126]|uniref:hypothetical protein n=1 Tax=Halobacterium sp. CBA1126 TaxID=2668074 RepID=UPI0012F9D78C|nr:hypothetical protein [Halobacterium sp. CBA1126]MUV61742.1 hypothetical protein [Halobacterium sp. CBA1126]
MTITDSQRETYQTAVEDFITQSEENTCLPTAVVNILDELAERRETPGLRVSEEEMLEYVDYDPLLGATTDFLPERLNPHLNSYNYEVKEDRSLSMSELNSIIEDELASYPIVEFDSRYFEWVDGYDADAGIYGRKQPHTVVPFAFNDETVLIFDPYEDFYLADPEVGTAPKEVPQPLFYEWWSGESAPRWSLCVEQMEQHTLDELEDSE